MLNLPNDDVLLTAIEISWEADTVGDKARMVRWAKLAHNYAIDMGYYGDNPHAKKIPLV